MSGRARRTGLPALVAASLLASSLTTLAEPPKATPDDLCGPLFTCLGAERPGNADGTIPAWDGGITAVPEDYRPSRHESDPFPDDAVLFTVTAAISTHRQAI